MGALCLIVILLICCCETLNGKHNPTTKCPTKKAVTRSPKKAILHAFTLEESVEMTELHNEHRESIKPPAADMNRLVWDARLVSVARKAIANCSFEEKNLHHIVLGDIGFNMFLGDRDVNSAFSTWHSEGKHFDLNEFRCTGYKKCGNFTQMMSSKTRGIGCFWNSCFKKGLYLLGCAYYPKYNAEDHLYVNGTPCTRCEGEDGGLCYKGLCVTANECKYLYGCVCNLKCHAGAELNISTCRCMCNESDYQTLDCSAPCDTCITEDTTTMCVTEELTEELTTTTTQTEATMAVTAKIIETTTTDRGSILGINLSLNAFFVVYLICTSLNCY